MAFAEKQSDTLVEHAKRLGATVMAPPTLIPDVGTFSVMLDAQKAAFAILQPKM